MSNKQPGTSNAGLFSNVRQIVLKVRDEDIAKKSEKVDRIQIERSQRLKAQRHKLCRRIDRQWTADGFNTEICRTYQESDGLIDPFAYPTANIASQRRNTIKACRACASPTRRDRSACRFGS